MTDWRTDEQIDRDGLSERWIPLEFALLLISFGALLLGGLLFTG